MIAHEFGHFVAALRSGIVVEEFAVGFPPRLLSTVRGGIRYSFNLLPLGAYVRMLGEEDPTAPGSFASKGKIVRSIVLAAGSGMNFLVAVAAFGIAYATGWPEARATDIEIAAVTAGSPAEIAGLRPGDLAVEIDGRPIRSLEDFANETRSRLGDPLRLTIDRGGTPVTLTVTPRKDWPEGQGPMGVRLQGRGRVIEPVSHPPLEAMWLGLRRAVDTVMLTFAAPVMVLRGELSAETVRPIGLPGMTQIAGQAASTAVQTGFWFPVLLITGVFSAGLSVANMLPLPALDGGRLLFVLIEAIRGKRVPPEREGLIHLVGMAVLISLMLLISFNDIVTPLQSIDFGVR
ncbi:MAG: hypothetical protein HW416_167 [Chloroflexi bacterium]|nr:hypothetical protein [Chloroflexota bacterium]